MGGVLTSCARRVAAPVLAIVVGLGIVGCDDSAPSSDPPPGTSTTVTDDATTTAPSESTGGDQPSSSSPPPSKAPSTSASKPTPSVAPNDAAILEGLRAQGYECKGKTRCQRVKSTIVEVIEVGPGRAVFVVKATRGKPADLSSALNSVLDDYGSVLPRHSFAGTDWKQFSSWADKHADAKHANGTIGGWHATLQAGGPKVRKLVLTLP